MKAITENQLHDFLINSGHSCKKYCLHNSTLRGITITVDPRIKGPVKLIELVKIAHSFLLSLSDQFHVIILSLPM